MNKAQLVGRLVKDPDIKYTQDGTGIARFTVAVDRRFKREGQPEADFISCVAFGKTAEFLEKYFIKGMRIGLTGRIQTGKYDDKGGKTVYTTDIVAEEVEFVERKQSSSETSIPAPQPDNDGFMNIPEGIDEELPFN